MQQGKDYNKQSEDRLLWLIKKTKKIERIVGRLSDKEGLLSENTKTGYSLNFPPARTCLTSSTSICREHCYAARMDRPITWGNSIAKQIRIYNYFLKEKGEIVARRLLSEIHGKKLPWVRWNGSGDLFLQSVKVINRIAEMDRSAKHLIITRNVRLAKMIRQDLDNIFLGFSLDGTRTSRDRKKILDRFGHKRMFYTYLRTNREEDTLGTQIVFNKQGSILQKERFREEGGRYCPVDAGMMKIDDGCNKCKKCISDRVLKIK